MTKQLFALSLGIALMVLAAQQAFAQDSRVCAARAQVVARLAEGYGETRQAMGLGTNNAVIEVFASEESGTWTITVTTPNGITCLMATGQAYEELTEVLRPTGLAI